MLCTLRCIPGADSTEAETAGTHQVLFKLGSAEELVLLYSYPNSDDGNNTLEETIEHYLTQTVERDLTVNGGVDVTVDGDTYQVTISGDSEHVKDYQKQISNFLISGKLALKAVRDLKRDDIWNEAEWRFFLPHGLSIAKQRSVQLLHFPPDYSLPEQNYLNSKTSQRWEKLLELNGIVHENVTLYEAILDIAPIAAPASAGSSLGDTYEYFEPYVLDMLPVLLKNQHLPIVAYGSPVRHWVSSYYNLNKFGVNSVDTIKVTDTISVPILGANHPSYIWYAKNQGRKAAFDVMEQDLVSACWQAKLGTSPHLVSTTVLQECYNYWRAHPMDVCINMEIQANHKTDAEAQESCNNDLPENDRRDEL